MNNTFADFTYQDENIEPGTFIVSFESDKKIHYVRYFDMNKAHEYATKVAGCVDIQTVDLMNGETGEILRHYKGNWDF